MWNYPEKPNKKTIPIQVKNARSFIWGTALTAFVGFLTGVSYFVEKASQRSREKMLALKPGKKVIVIGGGTAGATVAATISQFRPESSVLVLEPSRDHVFIAQVPLAMAGHRSYDLCTFGQNTLVNSAVWCVTREADLQLVGAKKIDPVKQEVIDTNGVVHPYDFLVLACGAQRDYNAVKGLTEEVADKGRICVNPHAVRDTLCSVKTGTILSCKLNPQPQRGDTEDSLLYGRQHEGNFISSVNVIWKFLKHFGRLSQSSFYAIYEDEFPSDRIPMAYNTRILRFWENRGTTPVPKHRLESIDSKNHIARFRDLTTGEKKDIDFKMLMLDLPLIAQPLIKESKLDGPGTRGFANVDYKTLQHKVFKNIFAIGDCAALPNPKSYGACFAQVPVVTHNISQLIDYEVEVDRRASYEVEMSVGEGFATMPEEEKKKQVSDRRLALLNQFNPPELQAHYNGYSSFHINMTTWRAIWPEMSEGNKRENFHLWDNSRYDSWRGFMNGVFLQLFAYETMYWLIFLRGWWYPPKWFSYPDFEAEAERRRKSGTNNGEAHSSA
jgi:thioredoxin reductase